jgi:ABC-type branched-subunit amino acid transport system permease subunit
MAALTLWVVSNVRRGRSGRRIIAVRTNERAAAALGIDVMSAKLFAFALASAIAALGGILLAFRLSSISYQSFTNFTSVTYVGLALVGGVGHLLGAFVGGTMATAGIQPAGPRVDWGGVGRYIQLISGIAILLTVLAYQDGVAAEWVKIFRYLKKARSGGARTSSSSPTSPIRTPTAHPHACRRDARASRGSPCATAR